jgi:hypothetical protein
MRPLTRLLKLLATTRRCVQLPQTRTAAAVHLVASAHGLARFAPTPLLPASVFLVDFVAHFARLTHSDPATPPRRGRMSAE